MKKIVSMLLALSMVFALCGVSAFAADPGSATLTAVVNANPADGWVGDPANIIEGSTFEVSVRMKNITTPNVFLIQAIVGWNPDVVEPVDKNGVATEKQAQCFIKGADFPDEDEDGNPLFKWQNSLDIAGTNYNATVYIDPDSDFAEAGYPIENAEVELMRIRFKAKKPGNADIKVLEKTSKGIPTSAWLGDVDTAATLTLETVDIVVQGGEPGPVEPVTKTIESVDTSSIKTSLDAGESYTIPTSLKGKIAGSDETVDVTVAWTPAVITETGKATGVVTAPADTAEVKYVLGDNAKTLTLDFTVAAPQPQDQVITGLVTPIEVENESDLPQTVEVNIEGGTTATVNVSWTVDADGKTATATVTSEGYVLGDGVTLTATITPVTPPEPPIDEPKKVTKVVTEIPTEAVSEAELPDQIEVVFEDGTSGTVDVVWTQTADGWTMSFAQDSNVEFGENVVGSNDQPLDVRDGGLKVEAKPLETPINIEDAAIISGPGGTGINFTISYNDAYEGDLSVALNNDKTQLAEGVWAIYTLYSNDTPVAVGGQFFTAGTAFGSGQKLTIKDAANLEFDTADISIVARVNFDPDQILDPSQPGDPVARLNGLTK